IPVVLFIGVALIATQVIFRLRDALEREEHSHEVVRLALSQREQLDQMRLAVRLVPMGRPEVAADRYLAARREFLHLQEQLLEKVNDKRAQLAQLRTVAGLEERWHRIVEPYLADPDKGLAAPDETAEEFTRRARAVTDPLEAAFQTFLDEEERL